MADNFDLKFQEVKNAIYFLAETLERKYVENNAKVDRLAESVDHLATSLPAGGAGAASADPELKQKLDALKQTVSGLSSTDLSKLGETAAKLSAAADALSKARPSGVDEKIAALSAQVAELQKQNKVLIDAVTLIVSELEAVKAAEHSA